MTKASHQSEQTSQSLFDKLPQITSCNYLDELNRLFSIFSPLPTPYARTICSSAPLTKS